MGGQVCLFALDLRHAEALTSGCGWAPCQCGAAEPSFSGRALISAVALGECHTALRPLHETLLPTSAAGALRSTVPMCEAFEDAYKAGADSVYFPGQGVVALLNPMRALPLFLAEYQRRRLF